MATITPFIRTSKQSKEVNVRFRLRDGRSISLFHTSDIKVNPDYLDKARFEIKAKLSELSISKREKDIFNSSIQLRKSIVLKAYQNLQGKPDLTSEQLETEIDRLLNPDKYQGQKVKQTFFETFEEFINKHQISEVRKSNYRVVLRALQRFELYKVATTNKPFKLSIDSLNSDILLDFNKFLSDESAICEKYPHIYLAVPETRKPQPRGQNTLSGIFTKLRTFVLWCINQERTTNDPFKKFSIPSEVYGTPYYITIEERNQLYNFDLSHNKQLATQRDIFVFQCLIGCRVGDLLKLTKHSLMNGAIEYIPRKTKEGNPITIRVPLNKIAIEIIERYTDPQRETLLPFISEQKYNIYIKEAFTLSGLKRIVTIINPTTRQEEKKPLNEIASSHLARRCFVGNLYKQVKDPNLVSSLSGHKEGSKAFARYREIDEQMKKDLINLLD